MELVRRRFIGTALGGAFAALTNARATQPDKAARSVNPAGHYRVESRNGLWWWVDPTGELEVSVGVNHVEPVLMLGPYNRASTLERYGSDFVLARAREDTVEAQTGHTGNDIEACAVATLDFNPHGLAARKWMARVLADLDDWHFNALGFHTSVPRNLFRERLPYVQPIRSFRVEIYWEEKQELPDVFGQEFEQRVDAAVRPIAVDCASDPNLLGYAFCDVPPWTGYRGFGNHPISPWVDAIRSLPPEAPGKKAWVNILKARYRNAGAAATTHVVDAATWEDLSALRTWPLPDSDPALADTEELLSRIADRWHKAHVDAIRRYDSHHLVLGDKILANLPVPDFLLPILKRYVDVVNIQWSGHFKEQEATLRRIYGATGKPILLGDSAFSHRQPNQSRSKGVACSSLEEVGRAYAGYLHDALSQPYIIGWHYCGYIEGWNGLPHSLCAAQCGFKNPFDKVHEETVGHVRRANASAHAWHANATVP